MDFPVCWCPNFKHMELLGMDTCKQLSLSSSHQKPMVMSCLLRQRPGKSIREGREQECKKRQESLDLVLSMLAIQYLAEEMTKVAQSEGKVVIVLKTSLWFGEPPHLDAAHLPPCEGCKWGGIVCGDLEL